VKRYRDQVAARQAEAERVLWLRAVGEFPPAVEAAERDGYCFTGISRRTARADLSSRIPKKMGCRR
jgi:hypothetical protein